jgi:PIN domain nuclease of toxin-antitoxin system
MPDVRAVLDASALLALFHSEEGREVVERYIADGGAVVSSVNYCEVVGKTDELGKDVDEFVRRFALLDVALIAFDGELASKAGRLQRRTRPLGLSLADRACLALSAHHHVPAVTADQEWAKLRPEFQIELIR